MVIFLNDSKSQFIREGLVFNPGENTVSEEVWEEVKSNNWGKHLFEKGILSEKHPTAEVE